MCWQETLWILNFSPGVLNRDYKAGSRESLSSVPCGKAGAVASLGCSCVTAYLRDTTDGEFAPLRGNHWSFSSAFFSSIITSAEEAKADQCFAEDACIQRLNLQLQGI